MGSEIAVETLLVGLFLMLFFEGYQWARWVATILLVVFGLVAGSMTFEGFGPGYISISLLYGALILMMFRHRAPSAAQGAATVRPGDASEVIDWFPEASSAAEPPSDKFKIGDEIYRYPMLVKRYQSVMIDFVLWCSLMIISMAFFGDSEIRQPLMIAIGVFFALVYEPLLTTYAATLGQYAIGIRVRDARKPNKRINILQAYIRILVKYLLGWISFVTINFNPKHRAIHDLAGSSVVIRIK